MSHWALAMQLLGFSLSRGTDEFPQVSIPVSVPLWHCCHLGGTAVTLPGPAGRLSGLVLRQGALANINI